MNAPAPRCKPQNLMLGNPVQFAQAHTYFDSTEIDAMLTSDFWMPIAHRQQNDRLAAGDTIRIVQVTLPQQPMNVTRQMRSLIVAAYVDVTVIAVTEQGPILYADTPIKRINYEAPKPVAVPMPKLPVGVEEIKAPLPADPATSVSVVDEVVPTKDAVEQPAPAVPKIDKIAFSFRHKGGGDYVVEDVNQKPIHLFRRTDYMNPDGTSSAKEAAIQFLDANRAPAEEGQAA